MQANSILNGLMSADIVGEIVEVPLHARNALISIQWPATGSPRGGFKLSVGAVRGRMVDIGLLDGDNFEAVAGAQPAGVASAGYLLVEITTGARFLQVNYTFTSGGAANSGAIADISFN